MIFLHFQGCEEVAIPLMSSPTSSSSSSLGGCVIRHAHHRVNFMEAVGENDDEGGALLPAPPATFSDPPPRCSVSTSPPNASKGFVVGQQLLRVHAPPSGHHAGIRELESSVSWHRLWLWIDLIYGRRLLLFHGDQGYYSRKDIHVTELVGEQDH